MTPTMTLRAMVRERWISDYRSERLYVIQQLWEADFEGERYTEWRDLPVVNEQEHESEWR